MRCWALWRVRVGVGKRWGWDENGAVEVVKGWGRIWGGGCG